mmetsp:Transcript_45009/g.80522  ORF Transcript_45009/g.80522 Transcript_45009/m.80522 type:complete len:260 (-) Transcript_45009:332-1111(-)
MPPRNSSNLPNDASKPSGDMAYLELITAALATLLLWCLSATNCSPKRAAMMRPQSPVNTAVISSWCRCRCSASGVISSPSDNLDKTIDRRCSVHNSMNGISDSRPFTMPVASNVGHNLWSNSCSEMLPSLLVSIPSNCCRSTEGSMSPLNACTHSSNDKVPDGSVASCSCRECTTAFVCSGATCTFCVSCTASHLACSGSSAKLIGCSAYPLFPSVTMGGTVGVTSACMGTDRGSFFSISDSALRHETCVQNKVLSASV